MNARPLVWWFSLVISSMATVALAGQDRAYYSPGGGPGQGGVIHNMLFIGSNIFVAVDGGGIYKSSDGGASWTSSHQGIGNDKQIKHIANDPVSTSIMYAVSNGGQGFYKSVDGGATWAPSNTGLNCRLLTNMDVAPNAGANQGHIYVTTGCGGTISGVYKSTNQGASWSQALSTNIGANSVHVSGDGTNVRVATNNGVYLSGNSGVSFSLSIGSITGPNGAVVQQVRGFNPGTGGVLSAVVEGNGVFWSTDSGTTWNQATGLPANARPHAGTSVIGNTLYVGLDHDGLYKSADGGKTWTAESSFNGLPADRTRQLDTNEADVVACGASCTFFARTWSGVYKSTDSGANWTKASSGLPGGLVNNAASAPSAPQIALAVSDTIYRSVDGGATWAVSNSGMTGATIGRRGPGGIVLFDPNNAAVAYASTYNGGMFKSTDSGVTWSAINNGLPANLVAAVAIFRIAPSDSNTIYLTLGITGKVFKTVDGGANWTDISVPFAVFARGVPAIDPANASIVYVATSGGLYKTENGGTSWQFKNPGGLAFGVSRPHAASSSLILLAAYVSDALDRPLSTSGLYVSQDGANTWQQIVANERMTYVVSVQSSNSPRYTVYAYSLGSETSDGGLFKCIDLQSLDKSALDQNCSRVDLGADPGQLRSLGVRSDRVLSMATTAGLARNRFMFLGPDFNNDGRADILWRKSATGDNAMWEMSGAQFRERDAFNAVHALRNVPSPWTIAGLGDFNHDGSTDILWRNTSTGENYIYFMESGNILSEGYIRTVADQHWQVAGVGDFDGDGASDILWRNDTTGENYIYFMQDLQIVSEGFIRTVADADWTVAGVGDFDGDSRADIFWRNVSTGENYLYPMSGLTIKGSEGFIRTVADQNWQVKGLGDFNQDNRMDIVWRNVSSGENYVYPMDGTQILPTETYLPTVADTTWDIARVGDFQGANNVSQANPMPGRGISGILWRNTSTGAAYLWSMVNPLDVSDSACGFMGCPQGDFLPQVSDTGWQIIGN